MREGGQGEARRGSGGKHKPSHVRRSESWRAMGSPTGALLGRAGALNPMGVSCGALPSWSSHSRPGTCVRSDLTHQALTKV